MTSAADLIAYEGFSKLRLYRTGLREAFNAGLEWSKTDHYVI